MSDRRSVLANLMGGPPSERRQQQPRLPQGANGEENRDRNTSAMQDKLILRPATDSNSAPLAGRRSVASATSSPAGRQHKLKQRFTVIRKLGKGTYGKVQLAVNKETGQEVAIKTIKKTKIENEQDLERVRREIQIMSSIEHPHIIHIYEVFENKDKIVLIMQYAPGGELYEYVSQSKVLDELEARRLFRQIATAIYYCHKNKICHRDLKLENILLDEKNNAKLADFGLSNVFDKSRQLKTFCGSPLYASPEIVKGSPYEGPEVDCWSLGVLLYTLVYGAMPFDGSNFKRLVKQISEANYYEPQQRSQASPLIGRLLCADPLKRATIFDICQDPWVNNSAGQLLPSPQASRPLSPANRQHQQQPAHTSLLKVAQDMADLTPVRLDILLALAPASQPQEAVVSQSEPRAREPSPPPPPPPPQSFPLATQKSRLMEVDEERASSPVANFIVRDLAPAAEERQMDTTSELVREASDNKQMELEGPTEKMAETLSAEPSECEDKIEEEIAQPEAEVLSPTRRSPTIREGDIEATKGREAPPEFEGVVVTAGDEGVQERATSELDGTLPADESHLAVRQTESAPVSDRDERPKSADGTTDSEPRPKKVKKRIVVVKKKRKVPKKGDGESASEAHGGSAESETAAAQVKKASSTVTPSPGKVRIPETFKPEAAETQPPPTVATKAVRRQSALIADVSQKLLQQQQHFPSPSSREIEADQLQLACVRVSDKKSELERRTSLGTAQQTAGSSSGAPRGSQAQVGADDENGRADSPQRTESRRESSRLVESEGPAVVELIALRESQTTGEPKPAVDQGAGDEQLDSLVQNLTDRLAEATDGRSDSVDTIKAELPPGASSSGASPRPNVRSSLQISLSPASGPTAAPQVSGPAPIARSYKKVTFTRDGTCVTETGRIYSARGDDGTVRRVERKSKVTHYPSDDAARAGEREETHEEIVFEETPAIGPNSSQVGCWPATGRPFERLIMPASRDSLHFERDDDYEYDHAGVGPDDSLAREHPDCPMGRSDSASSCSSTSTDAFDDTFDTWTGAISMFGPRTGRLRNSLLGRPWGSPSPRLRQQARPFRQHAGSSAVSGERCGSVEPSGSLFADESGRHRHRHHHHHQRVGRRNQRRADSASGYESDACGQRPASATLGSARADFGSSQWFPRSRESLLDEGHADQLLASLDHQFGGSLLMQELELEHEKLRRKLAARRNQFWRGSTPALNELPARSLESRVETEARTRPGSSSSPNQQQQGRRVTTTVYVDLQPRSSLAQRQAQPSGVQLKPSTPLESAPLRRNTAGLADHLPPRSMRRSPSGLSSIASQVANLQLGQSVTQQQCASLDGQPPRRVSTASFIELKRSSSSSTQQQQPSSAKGQTPTTANSSSTTATFWADNCHTPTTIGADSSQHSRQQPFESEANCRIQSWLQQSAGNLSVSSGSKSSASETLPSSGRGDASQFLGREESMSTSLGGGGGQRARPPPIPGSRSPVRQTPATPTSTSSMTVRSTSRQSIGADSQSKVVAREVNSHETILIGGENLDGGTMFKRQATSDSAQVSSHSFVFPDGQQVVRTQKQTTTTTQVISSSSRRLVATPAQAGQPMRSVAGDPWPQSAATQTTNLGPPDDLLGGDEFDSLVGSGAELESRSSSSLLEQLRARGYRSMINQRLVDNQLQRSGAGPQQQQVTQDGDMNIVTNSSTSITMSSSGVGGGQQTSGGNGQQTKDSTHSTPTSSSSNNSSPLEPKLSSDFVEAPREQCGSEPQAQAAPVEQEAKGAELKVVAAASDSGSQDADEDEDVREAKANIREYLERMRETDKFLKSMHEEEEKFLQQRQELFVFNNLLLSTKLTGLKGGLRDSSDLTTSGGRVHSAPVNPYVHCAHSNGFFAALNSPTGAVSHSFAPPTATLAASSPISCFNSDLFGPAPAPTHTFRPRPLSAYTGDPLLEPVQPLQPSRYVLATGTGTAAPPSARWRRSRSQLGDPVEGFTAAAAARRRPLSANLDTLGTGGASPYLPSRNRRSASQMRPPASGYSLEPMVSEYKSSYGPHLAASRSPVRRAASPLFASGASPNLSDDEQGGEHDDMRAYRAASYVARASFDSRSTPRTFRGRSLTRDRQLSLETSAAEVGAPRSRDRRLSLAADLSGVGAPENSRLSELEQRIRANKRRRAELLSGISQVEGAPSSGPGSLARRKGASEGDSPSSREPKSAGAARDDDGGDDDDSFGWERPTRAAGRASGPASVAPRGPSGSEQAARGAHRPSRLESMEARIKRRSYCVRVSSPSRQRAGRQPTSARLVSGDE